MKITTRTIIFFIRNKVSEVVLVHTTQDQIFAMQTQLSDDVGHAGKQRECDMSQLSRLKNFLNS